MPLCCVLLLDRTNPTRLWMRPSQHALGSLLFSVLIIRVWLWGLWGRRASWKQVIRGGGWFISHVDWPRSNLQANNKAFIGTNSHDSVENEVYLWFMASTALLALCKPFCPQWIWLLVDSLSKQKGSVIQPQCLHCVWNGTKQSSSPKLIYSVLNYSFYSGVLLAERLRCPAVHYCPDSHRHKEI